MSTASRTAGSPLLQALGWKPYHELEAEEILAKLPDSDRAPALTLVAEPGIPPRTAIEILYKLAKKKPSARREIFRLAESDDPRDRSLAKTRAIELPPMPDPRLSLFDEWRRRGALMLERFPSDPLNPEIRDLLERIEALRRTLRQKQRVAREREEALAREAGA